ncbi:MAG: glycosyl hydrolase-related protein [Thermofilaceae archaeon]|nr:glycosyl hydrolase-related protein [Thermofilaceae archaeon]MCX8180417.1 glycosyl hydrolase-related protein [Thermofilaceae archaeon]MDW8003386.1 glycoside hydrolase family 38 C-terminal domain-containing protein [Thermofilaceae archaeon]
MTASLTLQEVERRFYELLAASIVEFKCVDEWVRKGEKLKLPYYSELCPDDLEVFENHFNLPELKGSKWLLRLDISGNGLLRVNGVPRQGVDEQHKIAVLEPGELKVTLEATPRRLFGENPSFFIFAGSSVAAVHWETFHLALALLDAVSLARSKPDLMQQLSEAAAEMELTPSVLQIYALQRLLYGHLLPEGSPEYRSLRWDLSYVANVYGDSVARSLLQDTPRPSLEEVLETVERVKARLPKGGSVGKVYLFGHAHIDTAWLWPFSETKRKIVRTFSTVAGLAKIGYRFTYVQSGAQNYKWLEEIDSGLFEEVRSLVEKGCWLPIGGMWVESDTQLVWGESLARQFLYGQLYFKEKFGKTSRIGWLPDSFGFSPQLPQLMKKAGIEVFVTHKVMWNDTNEFPYHAFIWEGLDGSEVIAHIIVSTYNGALTASELVGLWERYKQKDLAPAVHSYGFGDGGGGPTFLMLERLKHLKGFPGVPELVDAPSEEEYVAELQLTKGKLPRWKGEIYNEFHRGVYTTNAKVKKLMAEAESEARWAELSATLASLLKSTKYPRSELRDAWERLLRCQFHDVLPGSSNFEAYEEAYKDLEEAIASFRTITAKSLETIASGINVPKGSLIVFNCLPWTVRALVALPGNGYMLPDGRPLTVQEIDGRYVTVVEVPPTGYTTLLPGRPAAAEGGATAMVEGDKVILENEVIRVVVGGDGSLLSLYDKQLKSEMLASPSNLIKAHSDKPGNFDAWDIDKSTIESTGHEFKVVEKPQVKAAGPVIASVEYALKFKNSTVRQRITIRKSSRLLEVRTAVDWREKCYLVKAWFNLNVKTEKAYFEVPFGVVERRTIPANSWDEARYEVPALRWVDFSDGEKGLAIISPTRHGYSVKGSRVGLSLLKSPLHPNPWSDLGYQEMVYYLYPHPGDYKVGRVYEKAYEAWLNVKAFVKRDGEGGLPPSYSFLETQPGIIVEAVKLSEDGNRITLRLYEVEGRKRETTLKFSTPFEAYEANLLEEEQKPVGKGANLRIPFDAFEVKTLLLKQV